MKEQFKPLTNEGRERAEEIKWINENYSDANEQALVHILFEAKLLGIGDKLPEHLLPQVQRVMKLYNVPNIDIARRIVTIGCDIDSSLESGDSSTDVAIDHTDTLAAVVRNILEEKVTPVTEEVVKLVIKRTLKSLDGDFFVDHLIHVIEERLQIMASIPAPRFVIDETSRLIDVPEERKLTDAPEEKI